MGNEGNLNQINEQSLEASLLASEISSESSLLASETSLESSLLVSEISSESSPLANEELSESTVTPVAVPASESAVPTTNGSIVTVSSDDKLEEKKKNIFWWGVLAFFIPIVGLILFILWLKKSETKKKGKASGIGTLVGVIFSTIFSTIFSIILLNHPTGIEGLRTKKQKLQVVVNSMNEEKFVDNYEDYFFESNFEKIEFSLKDKNKIEIDVIETEELEDYQDLEKELLLSIYALKAKENIDSLLKKVKDQEIKDLDIEINILDESYSYDLEEFKEVTNADDAYNFIEDYLYGYMSDYLYNYSDYSYEDERYANISDYSKVKDYVIIKEGMVIDNQTDLDYPLYYT
ncbi:MAG: hypothetical protein ACK5LM_03000 [Lactovum sp.]